MKLRMMRLMACSRCGVKLTAKNKVKANKGPSGLFFKSECNKCDNHRRSKSYRLRKEHPYPEESYECPICFRSNLVFNLDHNHDTGEFRGWLCTRCNKGLGFFLDDPTVMTRALKYLESNGQRVS